MTKREDGGPAFGLQEPQAVHAIAYAEVQHITDSDERERAYIAARARAVGGMSLRDWFAGQALASLLLHPEACADASTAACAAYVMADAMIEARRG